jgi:hypothetical protein
MLVRATQGGHITGLMTSLYPKGVISLQYADDTLLFLEHDRVVACHLKWLMVCYENLCGMRINYHKSDMTPINLDEEEAQHYSRIFCCKVGSFPFRYLRVPLHYDKLRREDIQTMVDLIINRIPGLKDWRRRPEGGEWEPIKIPHRNLAYIPKPTRDPFLLTRSRLISYR